MNVEVKKVLKGVKKGKTYLFINGQKAFPIKEDLQVINSKIIYMDFNKDHLEYEIKTNKHTLHIKHCIGELGKKDRFYPRAMRKDELNKEV